MTTSAILCRLYCLSACAYDEAQCRYPEWGYQNLEWYISTGRMPKNIWGWRKPAETEV